jgi:spermidine synthase
MSASRPHTIEYHDDQGSCFGIAVEQRLHQEQSDFQLVEVWQSEHFGRVMTLDGLMMVSDRENFIYHEMLTHPVLLAHANPRHVAIIGGGDCGTLREVLRHETVERATQIEIDEAVTRAAQQWFPVLCEANGDPRAELLFEDGIAWIKQQADNSLDLLIVDSTDPVGPAEALFGEAFFTECRRVLRDDGYLVQQSESPLYHGDLIMAMKKRLTGAGFEGQHLLTFAQPIYPSGWWSAMVAGPDAPLHAQREPAELLAQLRYYTPAMQQAAQVLPAYLAKRWHRG